MKLSTACAPREVLDALGVAAGDVLFVHASMDWLEGGVGEAIGWIQALREAIGPMGTLCMPSYAWRGREGPPPGGVLDLLRTPTQVGLLSEVFRRMPATLRSAQYWVPVCASGPAAAELLEGQECVTQPFGPGTTFRRLMLCGAKVVGLGVSLNTSSLAHLADFDLAPRYPFPVFSDVPLEGVVIRADGRRLYSRSIVVLERVMAGYRPSALFDVSRPLSDELRTVQLGQTRMFAYTASRYYDAAKTIGTDALNRGAVPPWLSAVS